MQLEEGCHDGLVFVEGMWAWWKVLRENAIIVGGDTPSLVLH